MATSSTSYGSNAQASISSYTIRGSLGERIQAIGAQTHVTDTYVRSVLNDGGKPHTAVVHTSSRRVERYSDGDILTECRNLSFLFVDPHFRGTVCDPTRGGAKFTSTALDLPGEEKRRIYDEYETSLNSFIDMALGADLPSGIQPKKTTLRDLWNSFQKTQFAIVSRPSYESPYDYDASRGMGKWKNVMLSPDEITPLPPITFQELGITDRYLDQAIQTRDDAEAFFELVIACSRKQLFRHLSGMQADTSSEIPTELIDLPEDALSFTSEPTIEGFTRIFPLQGPAQARNEGLKVRTFSLELLSNIEDLQMPTLNELKKAVRRFLEKGAIEAKAGFTDFLKLIAVLEKEVAKLGNPSDGQKLIQMLKRHSELIALQSDLSPKQGPSRWDSVRMLVRSGLLKGHGPEIWPMPTLPESQTIVNLYPTIDGINILASSHRKAGRWLMHHTQVLSFRELCHSIQESCEGLRETILGWDNYSLIGVKDKSQEWMVNIAARYLPAEKMPVEVITTTHGDPLPFYLTQLPCKHFMMIDDCGYSCAQLINYLQSFLFNLRQNQPLKQAVHICIVYGFLPDSRHPESAFWKDFLAQFTAYNVHAQLVTSRITKTCETLLNEENVPTALRQQIAEFAPTKLPLLATEWKTPDFMSLGSYLTEGSIPINSWKPSDEFDFPILSVKSLDREAPITEIIPPYKRNRINPMDAIPSSSQTDGLRLTQTPPSPSDPPKIHPCMTILYWLAYIFTFSLVDLFPKKTSP